MKKVTPLQVAILRAVRDGGDVHQVPGFRGQSVTPMTRQGLIQWDGYKYLLLPAGVDALARAEAR